jgi:uncharacterized membrane protein YfcA
MNPIELQPVSGMWVTWAGTSFGHGGFYGPSKTGGTGIDTAVEFHEHIHTEQAELAMLFTLLLQLVTIAAYLANKQDPLWWVHLVLWTFGNLLSYACGAIVAAARGENPYIGNTNEESAYAQTELNKK